MSALDLSVSTDLEGSNKTKSENRMPAVRLKKSRPTRYTRLPSSAEATAAQ